MLRLQLYSCICQTVLEDSKLRIRHTIQHSITSRAVQYRQYIQTAEQQVHTYKRAEKPKSNVRVRCGCAIHRRGDSRHRCGRTGPVRSCGLCLWGCGRASLQPGAGAVALARGGPRP